MKQGVNFLRSAPLALAAIALCAGASPARANDDKSTITAALELIGVNLGEKPSVVDYRERAKLVLPPRRDVLPEPSAAERPANWPTNAASGSINTDRYARVRNAPPEQKRPSLVERALGSRETNIAPGTDDQPGLLQRMLSASAEPTASDTVEPPRRVLVEPPEGYRAPTQDLSKVRDTDGKKSSSWWNPLSYLGGGEDDKDPVARTAGSAPSAKPAATSKPAAPARTAAADSKRDEPQGAISTFRKILPGFLGGSDKD